VYLSNDEQRSDVYFYFLGVNPQTIRGSKTGVFIGCSASESHEAWSNDPEKIVGYEMTGCTRSMFANRLSFFFDFKGVCILFSKCIMVC
jgi:acyl transferase domain-containing protein